MSGSAGGWVRQAGAGTGHRSEPHVAGPGEPLLVGCAGEWDVEPVCVVLRYRLAAVGGAAAQQGAGAGAGGPVWAGAAGRAGSGWCGMAPVPGGVRGAGAAGGAVIAAGDSDARGGDAKSDTLSFLAASFGRLPAPEFADRRTILARHRDKLVLKGLMARLCLEERAIGDALDQAVAS